MATKKTKRIYRNTFMEPKRDGIKAKVVTEVDATPANLKKHNKEFDDAGKDYAHRIAETIEVAA